MTSSILLSSIFDWTWPQSGNFRFYLLQFIFWIGYFYLVGLIGSAPFALTRFRANAWTTLVLGAMGTLIACLSQSFFTLETEFDMASPYALIVSIVATGVLTPVVSIFLFICQGAENVDEEEMEQGMLYMQTEYDQDGTPIRARDQYGRRYAFDQNGELFDVKTKRYVSPNRVQFNDPQDEEEFVDPRYANGGYSQQGNYQRPNNYSQRAYPRESGPIRVARRKR